MTIRIPWQLGDDPHAPFPPAPRKHERKCSRRARRMDQQPRQRPGFDRVQVVRKHRSVVVERDVGGRRRDVRTDPVDEPVPVRELAGVEG